MIICQRLLNSRETDVTQIRSNTGIERIHLRSTVSLLIVALLHINQRMLTCSTIRTKYSWQNDWSQEELPYCDTCVKVPYQSHIWYSECGSTSAVPATHYCWVQMCLSMSHVFIPKRYLIRQPNAIQGWLPHSRTQVPQDVSYIYGGYALIHKIPWKLCRLMSHFVESILSM